MTRVLTILIIFTCSVSAREIFSSGADSVFTDEILVESNRLMMTNSNAPNMVQVLDEQYILSINGSSLTDALKLSDGVYIKNYGFNSGIKTISLNSTQSEHTLILLNGVRLNSSQNAQVDLSMYNLDNISRIEVSKGGSSSLYGSGAIGGVINIITEDFISPRPVGFNLIADAGSYGQRKFFGKFSHSFDLNSVNNVNYSLSYSDEQAVNDFVYNYKNGMNEVLKERENSDFSTQAFNFDLRYTDENKSALKLFANYSHFERGVPGADLGYSTGTARQIDYNLISNITYGRKLSDVFDLTADFSYKNSLQKYFDPATFNLPFKIDSYYRLNGYEASSALSYIPSDNFSLESGGDFSFNNMVSNETEDGNLFQGAVFLLSKIELDLSNASNIILYPSLRYDYFSNISEHNVVTGKLGVNIKPFSKTGLNLKSSIGNNFSAPTFNELYWRDLGNKNLRPEKSVSFDAGIYYRFKAFSMNEFEFSYFNINTTDRIIWTPVSGSIWRPINIGEVNSEGIDVSLRSSFYLGKRLNAESSVNYSYSNARKKNKDYENDPTYNKQLIYIPIEMAKASIMMNYLTTSKLLKCVSFNLFYNFTAKRYTNFENTQFVPRYDVFDGNIGLGFQKDEIEIGAKFIVNNILNEDYSELPGYPMPLRNYKLEISLKY
jgi:outer membrane cobalamin receptor